ncbi:MAG: alpha/beta fold hydrolase [Treponema sp.]|jgi:hypothetical protein|nr:alpha/beta fold hydrolase [Treponema sp.]
MELRILEVFAALLLFLPLIRPLVRGLWNLDGLVACPFLALGIMAALFPAYGFRPECIPLGLFALFMSLTHFLDLVSLLSGLHSDSYHERGLIFTFSTAMVFAFTLWVTLYYGPPMNLELNTEGVKTVILQDRTRNVELNARIYGLAAAPETAKAETAAKSLPGRPLLILIPPVSGSLYVADAVCAALRNRGFTVLTYSRPGFDSPAFDLKGMPIRLSIPGLYRLIRVLNRGLTDAAANEKGRAMEEGRRRDTEFLLEELSTNLKDALAGTDTGAVFLAGYGAGGAAITILAGDEAFISPHGEVRGVAAVEAPILSSLEGEPPPPLPAPPGNPVSAFFRRISSFAAGLMSKKITRVGIIPSPKIPALFLLSDRVIQERAGRYETVLKTLAASQSAALLAAVPGAGPFDYSGSPQYYPLYSVLFRGDAPPAQRLEAGPELTAALITNFAAMILENETGETGRLTTTVLNSGIHLETGGGWYNQDSRTILHP